MESQGISEEDRLAQRAAGAAQVERLRDAYLSLIEKCLTGTIYEDKAFEVVGDGKYDASVREVGRDWPSMAHTMIGVKRLANLRMLAEKVIRNGVPGDFIETGVWRGGACILMRAVLHAFDITDRRVWVADSFEGLPAPDEQNYPADKGSDYHTYRELVVPLETVRRNIEKYGLLDDQIVFLKGWFKDALPAAPIKRLAILRLDGDLYESTIIALNALYDKLSADGYVIVDDYHVVPGCQSAIHDFLAARRIQPQICEIDGLGVYWQKSYQIDPLEKAKERLSLQEPRGPTPRPQSKNEGSDPLVPAQNIRLLAFFLPQFHPIPENDLWWGKGFTEWTNVAKAGPSFQGHYQPHLPGELGFYDLRVRETRLEQIALAKQYGIDGFCYYYYWFSGRRILDRPLDDMLSDPESDMPFCLCWANENWTRRWDGANHEILIAQQYLPTDDREFIKSLVPFFNDPRYIRLNGAPFFIVYKPQHLPDPLKTLDTWREYCVQNGIGKIHICAALTNDNQNYVKLGFDSGVQFPPHNRKCGNVNDKIDFYTPFHGCVVEYADLAQSYVDEVYPHPNVFRTVCPSWDQTARVGPRAFIVVNGTPANYEYWLKESMRRTAEDVPGQQRFVFINAWNEWAEGCHLEPDRRYQRQFLEATLRVKTNQSEKTAFEDKGLPKAIDPMTSVAVRLNEVEKDLRIETRHRKTAEQNLADERERLTEVYREIEKRREDVAGLEQALAASRERASALEQKLSSTQRIITGLDTQLSTEKQAVSALEQQLSTLKQQLSDIHHSWLWRITRARR
jgi:hypothetical protein